MKSIFCFDDLLRDEWWPAKNFFYDLVRVPIRQALDLNIEETPRNGGLHNLKSGFSPEKFKELCFCKDKKKQWFDLYYKIPQAAESYLLEYIPEDSICVSYEMPPYLYNIFQSNKIAYIDMRISPIRFGADLYIAFNTNISAIDQQIRKYHVSPEELFIEANLLRASFNIMEKYTGYKYDLNNCTIFFGQTPDDASLVGENGRFLKIEDFLTDIGQHCSKSTIYYKAHPNATKQHITYEIETLNKALSGKVNIINDNTYKLLSYPCKFKAIGISSGVLQEAIYFDKDVVILYRPVCPLHDDSPSPHVRAYSHVHFNNIVSPSFWFNIFGDNNDTKCRFCSYPSYPNRLRELHNVWWGYSESIISGKHFYYEIIKHTGIEDRILSFQEKIHQDMQNMQNTISWKITKPLRWFGKLIGY